MSSNSKDVSIRQFLQPTVMTIDSARQLLRIGVERLNTGHCKVDLSKLFVFDSSALAILLAWKRMAQACNTTLLISSMPEKLFNLANVYGVEKFLL